MQGARVGDSGMLVAVPIFALALPILDTSLAIVRRWLRGVPLSGADARHIHHRFLALGFSHRRTAAMMCGIAAVIAAMGLALAFAPPSTLIMLTVLASGLMLTLFLVALRRLDYHEFTVAGSAVR